ncbi:MAG: hypothetical protein IJX80_03880 [Clostridia bacterium]|nr:hypothetical protein [Clostridia bacterium]
MNWNDVYGSFKRFAAHTAVRLNQTADMATLQVALASAEKKLDEAYGLLGRVSYDHFSGDDDLSEKVLAAVKAVDQAREEVKDAQEKINEARRRAEAQNAAYEADKAARAAKAEAEARAEAERVAEEMARAAAAAREEQAAQAKHTPTAPITEENSGAEEKPTSKVVIPLTSLSDADDAVEVEVTLEESF